MVRYTAFWGCFVQGRFPFMEKSLRLVLDQLGFGFADLEGFTCCPEKSLIMNQSEEAWLLTAARNLSLCDEAGLDVFSPCNGCVSTLKGARHHLLNHPDLLRQVNDRLASVGHHFSGESRVFHLIEVLHDQIGPDLIKRRVTNPLKGMRVAVHAGCHQMRPSNEVRVDNPMDPVKFEKIVRALGAEVVDYPSKLLCCGGTMNTAGLPEKAREMTREKLRELAGTVDVMAVICPACFMQYDIAQLEMEREGHHYGVPVAVLSELMALAFGLPLDNLGLELHRIPVAPVLEKWSGTGQLKAAVAQRIDLEAMQACVDCQACTRDCRVHKLDDSYQPWQIFQKVLDGDVEGALTDRSLFQCVECYECSELCYQRWGMIKGIRELKHLAIEGGHAPDAVTAGIEAFSSGGVLTPASASRRAKLGLPPAKKAPTEELQKLLGIEASSDKPAGERGARKRKAKPDAE